MSYNPKPQDNHLLAALSPEVQKRLFPYLQIVELKLYQLLYESSGSARHVYFPTNSVLSLQYSLQNGASTALTTVGNEGLVGISWFLANKSATARALVQRAGFAYRLPKSRVLEEFDRHEELMLLTLRYTQAIITQVSQTALCNRHHPITDQFCRWLLISLDRSSDTQLQMTQEFLANMLGVRRGGITEAASKLRRQKVITYARGKINVIDRAKLEKLACECYQVVKNQTDMLLDYLPQRQLISDADSVPTVAVKSPQGGKKISVPSA